MKIAFDAKRMLNNATGLGNHARILANAMMRDYPSQEYLFFSPRVNDDLKRQLHGQYQIHLPTTTISKILHPWWRSYGITEDLLKNMVDIYHGLSNELPLNIHRSGIRSVVTIHDLIFLKHKEQYPWIDRQGYIYKTKYAVKHASKIIAVSEETKADLMEMYHVPEQKIQVIYQSIDERFGRIALPEGIKAVRERYNLPEKYILHVGSFFARKNQLTLIDAFDRIKNDIEHDLILIGSAGDMKSKISKAIADKKLEQRVRVIDDASNNDLPILYRCAALFVFPGLFEGFGMPVLEALASGTPVIASRGGAIEEAAGIGSVLVDPYSVDDISTRMLLVLKNRDLMNQMTAQGYQHAATMTDGIFAQKVMQVYEEILS